MCCVCESFLTKIVIKISRLTILTSITAALAPCIGLCYHNKVMALEATNGEVADDDLEFNRGWPLNAADFDKPCVGVCHYFREMGMVNPFTPKPSR